MVVVVVVATFSATVQTGPGAHRATCTNGYRGVGSGRSVALTTHHHLPPRLKKEHSCTFLCFWAYVVSYRASFTFTLAVNCHKVTALAAAHTIGLLRPDILGSPDTFWSSRIALFLYIWPSRKFLIRSFRVRLATQTRARKTTNSWFFGLLIGRALRQKASLCLRR